ncbi:MAG: AAA family ATPase, partial [Methylotenera sp.]|nr:AAA family ATPase [Methylotenera sp.]
MPTDIKFELSATDLGPHQNLNFNSSLSSLKIGIYASNGSGKTFLSRVIRCLDSNETTHSNKLISFGKNQSTFILKISNKDDPVKPTRTLQISLYKNNIPSSKNDTDYIFHVFNSDYVQENLELMSYRPNAEIDGYIIGKDVIDLTKEKFELESIEKDITLKTEQLKKTVEVHKKELDLLSINKGTTEYKEFNFDNIFFKKLKYETQDSFDDLKKQNTTLNKLPDDYEDIKKASFEANFDFLDSVKTHLLTKHNKSLFAEDFKNKIKGKHRFIEEGLRLKSNTSCPFCEQLLSEKAIELIDEYTKFLNDQEAKVINITANLIKQLEALKKQIETNFTNHLKIKVKFDELKSYLPSHKDKSMKDLQNTEIISPYFELIENCLNQKKDNIEKVTDLSILSQAIRAISTYISSSSSSIANDNQLISKINVTKDDLSKEKLAIKKKLCQAKYITTSNLLAHPIKEIKDKQIQLNKLKTEIAEKENKVKASKKAVVDKSFESFLNEFFAGKYTFDKENRCLKFKEQNLIENASDVLSEGEKSIVAFCYYLAESHKKVSTEDDYKRLFFVMDDPISSLDFHYVYSVAQ